MSYPGARGKAAATTMQSLVDYFGRIDIRDVEDGACYGSITRLDDGRYEGIRRRPGGVRDERRFATCDEAEAFARAAS